MNLAVAFHENLDWILPPHCSRVSRKRVRQLPESLYVEVSDPC